LGRIDRGDFRDQECGEDESSDKIWTVKMNDDLKKICRRNESAMRERGTKTIHDEAPGL
jgi:hypothetical protein